MYDHCSVGLKLKFPVSIDFIFILKTSKYQRLVILASQTVIFFFSDEQDRPRVQLLSKAFDMCTLIKCAFTSKPFLGILKQQPLTCALFSGENQLLRKRFSRKKSIQFLRLNTSNKHTLNTPSRLYASPALQKLTLDFSTP